MSNNVPDIKVDMLGAALGYARRGWPVFPVHTMRNGKCACGTDCGRNAAKHPMTKNGVKDATTDEAIINKWWSHWPDANIGFAVSAGMVVLDVDIKHAEGKYGDETLLEWEAVNGKLPETVVAMTGSGGLHYYFNTNAPARNTTNFLPSLDSRAEGGYVLLPPSLHANGRRYEWEASSEPEDTPVAQVPETLYRAVMFDAKSTTVEVPEAIPEGARNDTLFRLACSLRARGLTETEIMAAARQVNNRCSPPMDDKELGKIVHSAARYEVGSLSKGVATQPQPQGFKELIPFEHSEPLPPFPLGALSPATQEYVYAAAETVQAPVDMVGATVLGVLEIACKGRYPVRLPNDHIERPCLYIAPIAPPSERKSGTIDLVSRPLIDYEIQYNQDHSAEVAYNRSELKLLQGRINSAEQAAIKAKKHEDRLVAENELHELNAELAKFETIEPMRLYGADVTPEKLAAMIKSQGGVFALVSAEGGGLFENIGRYSDKGGLEIYLNGYSGDRICVDRKTSDSIVIDRPTLTMIAPCQPSVIVDLFSDTQKAGRGLLSRILFAKCPSRVGTRKTAGKPLNERIEANYRNICHNALAAASKGNLSYDSDGFEVYAAFFDEIEPQLTPDEGELSFMGDWAGKIPGQMTRFAGLIHCINAFESGGNPLDTAINADEARAAVDLARYYLAHAKAVYMEQTEPESIGNARYLWKKINSINSLSISKSVITRKTQGKQNFGLDESLGVLVERGYIRMEHKQTGGAGRPSETIIVNPETETIVNKLNLLNKSPDADNNFNFFNIFTIPSDISIVVPNVKSVEALTHFTEMLPDDPSYNENPFAKNETKIVPISGQFGAVQTSADKSDDDLLPI